MHNELYKYRSLENFQNVVDIIVNSRLYAAKYKDLNDPMEGQYYYKDGSLDNEIRDKLIGLKADLRVCSLSKVPNDVLMWTHYADSHKGIVFEVLVKDRNCLRKIEYSGLLDVDNSSYHRQTAKEILTHKLKAWQYEKEVRAFGEYGSEYIDVRIKKIIFGKRTDKRLKDLLKKMVNKIDSRIIFEDVDLNID